MCYLESAIDIYIVNSFKFGFKTAAVLHLCVATLHTVNLSGNVLDCCLTHLAQVERNSQVTVELELKDEDNI